MRKSLNETDGAWLIGLIAVSLMIWGIVEFLQLWPDRPAQTVDAMPAAERINEPMERAAIEMHRLLPDATRELGTRVRVDGMVVGDAERSGFWVQDLRDNVVFVDSDPAALPPAPGDAVRVLGTVALLPVREQADHWEGVRGSVPPSALIVRDVKVVPVDGGIEVLTRDE